MSARAAGGERSGPLRVLQLHGTFDRGAKEARVIRLMTHWGARASHDILIGDPAADGARVDVDPGLAVRFLDGPALRGRPTSGMLLALGRLMQRYDLVLSFGWGAINGAMAHRLLRRVEQLPPLIHHEDGSAQDGGTARNSTRNLYRRIALAGVYALVVPSNRLAHVAQQEWHLKAERVHQIPNGIDTAAYAVPPQLSAIPGLVADGRIVVGTVAEPGQVAHLHALMRAIAPLRGRLRLVVVGEIEESEAIRAQAAALGMDDVLMAGSPPHPRDYIGAFDIFALSPDGGPVPVALVAAMAAGLPVIAADAADVSAMVAPGNRRFVVPPGDTARLRAALETLAADPALRAQLGDLNRLRARQCFDEAVMFQLYDRLYGAAVGDARALV
ncbi:MAG: glycosyl transferase family 1 [Sphingobium sp. 66-54]|nr:MAG: glycosyl transferase family 1 [Sphingobium sp. 66-54]